MTADKVKLSRDELSMAIALLLHASDSQLTRLYDPMHGYCIIVARTPETAMAVSQTYDAIVNGHKSPDAKAAFATPLVLTDKA